MVMLDQVAQLVDDDVVDARLGRLDQLEVESDNAGVGAASPAVLHAAYG